MIDASSQMTPKLTLEQFAELARLRGFDLTPEEIDDYHLIWTAHHWKTLEVLRLRLPGGVS